MNFSVVVISKNQADMIPAMMDALNSQLPSVEIVYVLDRCTDNSRNVLSRYKVTVAMREHTECIGFCAGTARNLGADMVHKGNHILFLDGDRIPSGLSLSLLQQAIDKYDITLLSCTNDARAWFSTDYFCENVFSNNSIDNGVWSMGVLIKNTAVAQFRQVQSGDIFNRAFDGNWGCEDNFLGYLGQLLGMKIGGFPTTAKVSGNVTFNGGSTYTMQIEICNMLLRKYNSIKCNNGFATPAMTAVPSIRHSIGLPNVRSLESHWNTMTNIMTKNFQ